MLGPPSEKAAQVTPQNLYGQLLVTWSLSLAIIYSQNHLENKAILLQTYPPTYQNLASRPLPHYLTTTLSYYRTAQFFFHFCANVCLNLLYRSRRINSDPALRVFGCHL